MRVQHNSLDAQNAAILSDSTLDTLFLLLKIRLYFNILNSAIYIDTKKMQIYSYVRKTETGYLITQFHPR